MALNALPCFSDGLDRPEPDGVHWAAVGGFCPMGGSQAVITAVVCAPLDKLFIFFSFLGSQTYVFGLTLRKVQIAYEKGFLWGCSLWKQTGHGSFLSMYTVRAGCMMRPAGIQLPIKPALPRLFHCCLDPHHAGHYNTHTIIPWACSKVSHLSDTHITTACQGGDSSQVQTGFVCAEGSCGSQGMAPVQPWQIHCQSLIPS